MKHEKSCLIVSGTTATPRGFVWLTGDGFKTLEGLLLTLDTHTGGLIVFCLRVQRRLKS